MLRRFAVLIAVLAVGLSLVSAQTAQAATVAAPTVAVPGPAVPTGPLGLRGPLGSPTPTSFWLATAQGDVWNFGSAGSYGAPASGPLGHPIVGITPTPDRKGYWLVDAGGGVYAYGDAPFAGSTGALRLTQPIVGMAATSDGAGYWLVARDGGIFAFGDAAFFGSTGAVRLNQPIVAMAPAPDAGGYWLLAADGGVFTFGDAGFHGSAGAAPTPDPAEKIVADRSGGGYWIVDQNGTAAPFGDATGAPPAQGLLFAPVTAGDRAVLFAFAQLGKPYVWGGNGPAGYDCSGLALASWEHGASVGFARVANDQYHTAGTPVPMAALSAGDLVFWGSNAADWTTVYHAAMYVGGGRIVEATGDHVQLNALGQWGVADLMPNGRRP